MFAASSKPPVTANTTEAAWLYTTSPILRYEKKIAFSFKLCYDKNKYSTKVDFCIHGNG